MRMVLYLICACVILGSFQAIAAEQEETIGATMQDYKWWREARFGIFIHWGPGSVIYKHGWAREDIPPEGHRSYMDKAYNASGEPVPPEIHSGEYLKYRNTAKVPMDVYDNLYRVFNPTGFDAEE